MRVWRSGKTAGSSCRPLSTLLSTLVPAVDASSPAWKVFGNLNTFSPRDVNLTTLTAAAKKQAKNRKGGGEKTMNELLIRLDCDRRSLLRHHHHTAALSDEDHEQLAHYLEHLPMANTARLSQIINGVMARGDTGNAWELFCLWAGRDRATFRRVPSGDAADDITLANMAAFPMDRSLVEAGASSAGLLGAHLHVVSPLFPVVLQLLCASGKWECLGELLTSVQQRWEHPFVSREEWADLQSFCLEVCLASACNGVLKNTPTGALHHARSDPLCSLPQALSEALQLALTHVVHALRSSSRRYDNDADGRWLRTVADRTLHNVWLHIGQFDLFQRQHKVQRYYNLAIPWVNLYRGTRASLAAPSCVATLRVFWLLHLASRPNTFAEDMEDRGRELTLGNWAARLVAKATPCGKKTDTASRQGVVAVEISSGLDDWTCMSPTEEACLISDWAVKAYAMGVSVTATNCCGVAVYLAYLHVLALCGDERVWAAVDEDISPFAQGSLTSRARLLAFKSLTSSGGTPTALQVLLEGDDIASVWSLGQKEKRLELAVRLLLFSGGQADGRSLFLDDVEALTAYGGYCDIAVGSEDWYHSRSHWLRLLIAYSKGHLAAALARDAAVVKLVWEYYSLLSCTPRRDLLLSSRPELRAVLQPDILLMAWATLSAYTRILTESRAVLPDIDDLDAFAEALRTTVQRGEQQGAAVSEALSTLRRQIGVSDRGSCDPRRNVLQLFTGSADNTCSALKVPTFIVDKLAVSVAIALWEDQELVAALLEWVEPVTALHPRPLLMGVLAQQVLEYPTGCGVDALVRSFIVRHCCEHHGDALRNFRTNHCYVSALMRVSCNNNMRGLSGASAVEFSSSPERLVLFPFRQIGNGKRAVHTGPIAEGGSTVAAAMTMSDVRRGIPRRLAETISAQQVQRMVTQRRSLHEGTPLQHVLQCCSGFDDT